MSFADSAISFCEANMSCGGEQLFEVFILVKSGSFLCSITRFMLKARVRNSPESSTGFLESRHPLPSYQFHILLKNYMLEDGEAIIPIFQKDAVDP
ncbi:hypothetical protein TNIN_450991 [Trichonephila inaurata madagascariensis]|uniref:Uncharacterized protein n=1 Tax=Trichonephila inaurata madagascariensis TaxID=2747483 RepID=A0A8X6Y5C4_9ARAC|nr:hypothetical protein TNIN_450991 [Trichonephila inaurata madagascariensis]